MCTPPPQAPLFLGVVGVQQTQSQSQSQSLIQSLIQSLTQTQTQTLIQTLIQTLSQNPSLHHQLPYPPSHSPPLGVSHGREGCSQVHGVL